MSDSRVSVGGAVTYAWSLWWKNWRSVWGVLALTSLAATVYMAGDFAGNQPIYIGGIAVSLLISFMNSGAIFRLAFADRHPGDPAFHPGPMGLQWRAMEWRLVGASALLLAFYLIIGLVALVAIGGLGMGIAMNKGAITALTTPQALVAALGPTGAGAVSLLAVVFYIAFIVVAVRLCLATAATADSGRIAVLRTWALTKGQFWKILVTILLIELPVVFIGGIVAAAGGQGQMTVTAPDHMVPAAALTCGLIMGVLTGGVLSPLLTGVLAYYYRNLKGAPDPNVVSK